MNEAHPFRIVFMGTPEFAVPTLKLLHDEGFQIVGVITAPDKPQGRGKKLGTSPVKDFAVEAGIPVLQPTNLKDPEFQSHLKSLQADIQIVVAFRMLPEAVWNMPPKGSFNLHASLLPDYRGAAPINWAIINGEKQTGITTFKLQHEIDTGNILFQESEPIHTEDNVGTLYERLMHKGARLMLKSVKAIESGNYELQAQTSQEINKNAPKIFREDCEINWDHPSETIINFVRGLSPYPGAWTRLDGQVTKIFRVVKSQNVPSAPSGSLHSDGKHFLAFGTSSEALNVEELQLQGKKRMGIKEFLRGYQMKAK